MFPSTVLMLNPNFTARTNVTLTEIEAQLAKLDGMNETEQFEVIEQVIVALEELVS